MQKAYFCSEKCKMRAFSTHHRKVCSAGFYQPMFFFENVAAESDGVPTLRWRPRAMGQDSLHQGATVTIGTLPATRPATAAEKYENTKKV